MSGSVQQRGQPAAVLLLHQDVQEQHEGRSVLSAVQPGRVPQVRNDHDEETEHHLTHLEGLMVSTAADQTKATRCPGVSRRVQVSVGGSRCQQEGPGVSRRVQVSVGGSRSQQEGPGVSRRVQESVGGSRSQQEGPGVSRRVQESVGGSRCQ